MRRSFSPKAKGQAMIEMILSLVMFAIQLSLVATLSVYLYMQHTLISAAREGARVAAVSQNFQNGDDATGTQEVETRVTQFFSQTTGQTMSTASGGNTIIVVTPPASLASGGVVGQRTVQVQVTYRITNPLNIAGFINLFSAATDTTSLQTFPITASASMRFEE